MDTVGTYSIIYKCNIYRLQVTTQCICILDLTVKTYCYMYYSGENPRSHINKIPVRTNDVNITCNVKSVRTHRLVTLINILMLTHTRQNKKNRLTLYDMSIVVKRHIHVRSVKMLIHKCHTVLNRSIVVRSHMNVTIVKRIVVLWSQIQGLWSSLQLCNREMNKDMINSFYLK